MVSLPSRFYRGIVYSRQDNRHPSFKFIIVDTVKEIQDHNGNLIIDIFEDNTDFLLFNRDTGDTFYGVYGSYWSDMPKSSFMITETYDLNQAIRVAEEIMGNTIKDISYD